MMFLSIRHLLSRKKQSALILLGITIGTAAYVIISGMMLGFQEKLLDQLVNNDAHIRISSREEVLTSNTLGSFPNASHIFWKTPPSGRKDAQRIEYPVGWYNLLNKDIDVKAYSAQVSLNVIFNRGNVSYAGRIIGSNPYHQIKVTNINSYITDGTFSDIGTSGNRAIFGKALLEKLGARISETVQISSGKTMTPFKIVGAFDTGIKTIDETTVFVALADAQKLRGSSSEITDIAVKLTNPYLAIEKASYWRSFTNEKVLPWQEASANILSVFKTQDIVRNSMTIAIIIVAGFGIYNILSILVTQKRRDIAILRSIGFSPKEVVNLFFNQGIILGIIGGLLGLFIGHLICRIIGNIEVVPGRIGSNTGKMIVSYDYIIYLKGIFIALLSSILSSILPAQAAGKLDPMEIIRSGG